MPLPTLKPLSPRQAATVRALAKMLDAIVDVAREVGGAPESAIHLALQAEGATPAQCAETVALLIAVGRLRRENHQLFAVT